MKSKKFLIAAVLSASTVAMAGEGSFDGINAQIGIGGASVGNQATLSDEGGTSLTNKTSQANLLGTVAVGYSYSLPKQFNLAANVFYNFGSSDAGGFSQSFGDVYNSSWNSQVQNLWGISVEPGYYFADKSLGFVKLGWAMASTKQTGNNFINDGGVTINTGTANGFLYGLGFKQLVTDNVYLGVDVYQVLFSSTSTTYNYEYGSLNISSKPNYTYGGINVGYKF